VARQPTAVWLDRIAAITEGRGLRGHLDAALAQQAAGGRPVVATFVLYNLPNRACLRAPAGELDVRPSGVAQYRTEFIDPIAAILAEPRYRSLRIAVVIEPDAMLGQFVQGPAQTTSCLLFQQAGVYLNTIPYALTKLHEIPNVHAYLDAAQSNVLGWPTRLGPAADLFRQVADRTPAGVASVDGFAVNVGDYDPVEEPFLDIGQTVSGTSIRQSRFVDFNDHLEERTYVDALHAALLARGFPAQVGMLVDTSRNGWGGPQRPVRPSTSSQVDEFVDQSKVDRRRYRDTWCNQVGAGLGERPRAQPMARVDAYAWVKPPGESDGQYTSPIGTIEQQCDPSRTMPPISASSRPTNAMPGGTPRGQWFDAAFTELVRNAHPAL
jgi:cellulose 1,4-beta-cellobiosidase